MNETLDKEYKEALQKLSECNYLTDYGPEKVIADFLSLLEKQNEEKYGPFPKLDNEPTNGYKYVGDEKPYFLVRRILSLLGYHNLKSILSAIEKNGRQNEVYYELADFLKRKLGKQLESSENSFLREDLISHLNDNNTLLNNRQLIASTIEFFDNKALLDLLLFNAVEMKNENASEKNPRN